MKQAEEKSKPNSRVDRIKMLCAQHFAGLAQSDRLYTYIIAAAATASTSIRIFIFI